VSSRDAWAGRLGRVYGHASGMVGTMMMRFKRLALLNALLVLATACGPGHPMLGKKTFWPGKGFRFVGWFESPDFVKVGYSNIFSTLDGKYGCSVSEPRFQEYLMSEDGRYLAMRGDQLRNQRLAIYDMDRETREEICVCSRAGYRSMAWTKDNQLVFTHDNTDTNKNWYQPGEPPSVFVWSRKNGIHRVYSQKNDAGPWMHIDVSTTNLVAVDGYVGPYEGRLSVFSLVGDGSSILIAERGCQPAWSPDGARLAYAGHQPPENAGEFYEGHWNGLHVVRADGTGDRKITNFGCLPSWSPTGEWIAFISWEFELWLARPDGSETRRVVGFREGKILTYRKQEPVGLRRPSWSPDGRYVSVGLCTPPSELSSGSMFGLQPVALGGSIGFVADLREGHVIASRMRGVSRKFGVSVSFVPGGARERLLAYSRKHPRPVDWCEYFDVPFWRKICP
jgi:hypothetical protein